MVALQFLGAGVSLFVFGLCLGVIVSAMTSEY